MQMMMQQAPNSLLTVDLPLYEGRTTVPASALNSAWTDGCLPSLFRLDRMRPKFTGPCPAIPDLPEFARHESREGSARSLRIAGITAGMLFLFAGVVCQAAPRADAARAAAGSEAAVLDAIRARLAAISPWTADQIEVETAARSRGQEFPGVDRGLHVLMNSLPTSTRNVAVTIETASGEDAPARTFQFAVDIRVRATLLQAARRLPYGRVVEAGDLEEAAAEVRDLRREYIRSVPEIVGKVLRRTLAAGEPLTRDCVAAPQLVRFGEMVRVRAHSSGVVISALARAEQGGKLGELISVRSVDFLRSLRARVVGPGEVKVE